MNILALDIGERRTGVAFATAETGAPVTLQTIAHRTPGELGDEVLALLTARDIGTLVVGLPLLPSGEAGSQAVYVRETVRSWDLPAEISVIEIDERYTTPRQAGSEPDAEAACALLQTALDRLKRP